MTSQPYLRAADDGTYELLVPFAKDSVHILPYCFHTVEDAANWLASRKGREIIQHIRPKGEGTGTYQPTLYASSEAGDVLSIGSLSGVRKSGLPGFAKQLCEIKRI